MLFSYPPTLGTRSSRFTPLDTRHSSLATRHFSLDTRPSSLSPQNTICSRKPKVVEVPMLFLSILGSSPKGPVPMLTLSF